MSTIDYNDVAVFVRVARAGSFTAAAEAVGLPKSSVSRSVARLEDALGVRLLQRTTRTLALTDAGQAYYDTVGASVAAIDDADAAAREHGAEPRGVVRVSAAPHNPALATAIALFVRQHPAIRVELSLSSRFVDLVAEGFDLAVRAGRLEDSSLVVRRVGATELALMAAPAYLRRRGRPRRVAELSTHDFVVYRQSGGARTTLQLTGPDGDASVEVSGSIVADDIAFCRAAAEAGAGIALLPVHLVHGAVDAGRLEQVLPGWHHAGAALWVVLPSSRLVPARVALLRDFLVEHLGRELAEVRQRCQSPRRPPRPLRRRRASQAG